VSTERDLQRIYFCLVERSQDLAIMSEGTGTIILNRPPCGYLEENTRHEQVKISSFSRGICVGLVLLGQKSGSVRFAVRLTGGARVYQIPTSRHNHMRTFTY